MPSIHPLWHLWSPQVASDSKPSQTESMMPNPFAFVQDYGENKIYRFFNILYSIFIQMADQFFIGILYAQTKLDTKIKRGINS